MHVSIETFQLDNESDIFCVQFLECIEPLNIMFTFQSIALHIFVRVLSICGDWNQWKLRETQERIQRKSEIKSAPARRIGRRGKTTGRQRGLNKNFNRLCSHVRDSFNAIKVNRKRKRREKSIRENWMEKKLSQAIFYKNNIRWAYWK